MTDPCGHSNSTHPSGCWYARRDRPNLRLVGEPMGASHPSIRPLDHLCRKRECVNPRHLEPVPNHENLLRGEPANRTHCPAGHEYTPANTHLWNSKRKCRECGRVRAASRRAVLRERARIRDAVKGMPLPVGPDFQCIELHPEIIAAVLRIIEGETA